MAYLQKANAHPKFFYVVSHERSGTHFLMNCIQLNSQTNLNWLSVGEWYGPFGKPQTKFEHIRQKFEQINPEQPYMLKTHCDRDLFGHQYPDSKIVYIFRDYRDVLVSYYYFLKNLYIESARQRNPKIPPLWFESFSEFIRQPLPDFLRLNYSSSGNFSLPIERWLNHVIKWLDDPPENILVVTYNQLYYDGEKTTRKILKFLDLPQRAVFTRPTLESSHSVMPRKGIVGDWKNHFSLDDTTFLEPLVLEYLPLLNQYPWESKILVT